MVEKIADKQWKKMYGKSNNYHKARLNACKAQGASLWMQANPMPYSKLTNQEFRIIAYMWLGIQLCDDEIDCKYCDVRMDKYGAHAMTCKHGSNIVRRHDRIRNYLYRKMKEAGYCCQMEKKRLCEENGNKPADIYVDCLIDNKPTAIDVGIASPVQQSIIKNNNPKEFAAAEQLIKIKTRKYESLIQQNKVCYVPFVLEAFGGISGPARKIIKRLCHDLVTRTRRSYSVLMTTIQKCIVVRIWKSVVESVLERTFWKQRRGLDQW